MISVANDSSFPTSSSPQDFGLVTAMVLDEPAAPDLNAWHASAAVTHQHTDQVGTKLYMSPEQTSGLPYCEKVDIYSCGIIFYELLHPFATEMERGRALMALRQHHVIPEEIKKKKKEAKLLLQMIDHNPEERPSAERVKWAVEELEQHLGQVGH